jgi:hypothetical protein
MILTAVIMEGTLCDATPCIPVEMYQRFGGNSKRQTSMQPARGNE